MNSQTVSIGNGSLPLLFQEQIQLAEMDSHQELLN